MNSRADVLIIGGGPGGSSCALWLKMLGYTPCLLEKRSRLGGLQNESPYENNWIVGVPGLTGQEYADRIHEHLVSEGIRLELDADVIDVEESKQGFRARFVRGAVEHTVVGRIVVLASGVRAATGGLKAARDLLIGPGTPITTHDFADKTVAILGGGDSAFENYLFVDRRKPQRLDIYARTLRARKALLEQVPPERVYVGEYDVNDSHNTVNGKKYDCIVALYGWTAHLPFMSRFSLARNTSGFVITDEGCQTSVAGVYAIGEVAQRMHPCCVTSIADGVTAAKAIQRQLEIDAIPRYMKVAKRAVRLLTNHFERKPPHTVESPDQHTNEGSTWGA